MNRLLPLLIILLISTGCSSKKYYTLGTNINVKSNVTYTKPIDIVTVNIPKYLQDYILVRQTTPYQVKLLDKAQWLTPMKKRLTNVLIDYLQKSLHNPNVHLYPWNGNRDPYQRVSLSIKRFIAYEDKVYLDANYKIYNYKTKKSINELFSTTVPTDQTVDGMMKSMEKAYFKLIKKIQDAIIQQI